MFKEQNLNPYFLKCALGGSLACAISRTLFVPLDVVKCRRQIDPILYKGLIDGVKTILRQEGLKGLTLGWSATFMGYGGQGLFKFGLYEVNKKLASQHLPEFNKQYQKLTWCLSAALAEFMGDIALCSFEAVKVRMQTSRPGTIDTKLSVLMPKMIKQEGFASLFKGIGPLWARQIPYTVGKFVANEISTEYTYKNIIKQTKQETSTALQMKVALINGFFAGIVGAFVSHPADTIVSKLNSTSSKGPLLVNLQNIYGEIGFFGLWRGLNARICIIGPLVSFQLFMYDCWKQSLKL